MQCKTVSIISTPIALSSRMYKMLAKWCFEIIEFLQILKIIVEWELEMGPRRKRADDTDDICFWQSQNVSQLIYKKWNVILNIHPPTQLMYSHHIIIIYASILTHIYFKVIQMYVIILWWLLSLSTTFNFLFKMTGSGSGSTSASSSCGHRTKRKRKKSLKVSS